MMKQMPPNPFLNMAKRTIVTVQEHKRGRVQNRLPVLHFDLFSAHGPDSKGAS
jgi:hypothetical protein